MSRNLLNFDIVNEFGERNFKIQKIMKKIKKTIVNKADDINVYRYVSIYFDAFENINKC